MSLALDFQLDDLVLPPLQYPDRNRDRQMPCHDCLYVLPLPTMFPSVD